MSGRSGPWERVRLGTRVQAVDLRAETQEHEGLGCGRGGLGMYRCHSGCFGARGPWPALTWVPGVSLGGPRLLGAEQRVGGDYRRTGSIGGGDRAQRLCAGWAGDGRWGCQEQRLHFLRGCASTGC